LKHRFQSIVSSATPAKIVAIIGRSEIDPWMFGNCGIERQYPPPNIRALMPPLRNFKKSAIDFGERQIHIIKPIFSFIKIIRLFGATN